MSSFSDCWTFHWLFFTKQLGKFIIWGQKSREAWCTCFPYVLQKMDVYWELWKILSTAKRNGSEGAILQYMVMRNVQLSGLSKQEEHNKGGWEKEEDRTMLQTTLNYLYRTGIWAEEIWYFLGNWVINKKWPEYSWLECKKNNILMTNTGFSQGVADPQEIAKPLFTGNIISFPNIENTNLPKEILLET